MKGKDSVSRFEDTPPLVCAHGSMMRQSMFQPQLERLGACCSVITYDNVTWTNPDKRVSIDDLVEDCRAQMDAHGLDRCILLGMSMGGHMALEFALKYPERLKALILTGAGAVAFPQFVQDITSESFSELDMDGLVPRSWAERTAKVVFGKSTFEGNSALIAHWIDQWTKEPARAVYHQGMTWIHKRDLLEESRSLTMPVLIIQGAEETAYVNEWVDPMLEAVPDIRSVVIPEAGHFVNIEQSDAFNQAIAQFLVSL